MKQYPMVFEVSAESVSGIQTRWTSQAREFSEPVTLAIPPEFDGPGQGLSPEDLYAMALQNCFIATFKVFAEKSRLAYSSIRVHSRLEVDRNEAGSPWMARIHVKALLQGVEQVDNAKRILEKTSKSCMVLNSVNTVKTFEFEVQ